MNAPISIYGWRKRQALSEKQSSGRYFNSEREQKIQQVSLISSQVTNLKA